MLTEKWSAFFTRPCMASRNPRMTSPRLTMPTSSGRPPLLRTTGMLRNPVSTMASAATPIGASPSTLMTLARIISPTDISDVLARSRTSCSSVRRSTRNRSIFVTMPTSSLTAFVTGKALKS